MEENKIEESHRISDKPSSSPERPSSGSTGTYTPQSATAKSTDSTAQTSGADSISPGSKAGTATALKDSSRISREASSSGSPSGKASVSSDSFKEDMWKVMADSLKPQESGASTKNEENTALMQDGASNAERSMNNTGSGNANISDKAEVDKANEQNAQMAQASQVASHLPQMMQAGNNGSPTNALNDAGVQPLNENRTAADLDAAAVHKDGASPSDGSKPNEGTNLKDETMPKDGTKPDGEKKPDGKYDKYTVKEGDSLWKIAKENKIPFKDMLDANKDLKNPDLIHPDQKVNLPKSDKKVNDKNRQMQQMMQKMTELMNKTNDMMKKINEMSGKNGTMPNGEMKPHSETDPSNNSQNNNQQMMNQMMQMMQMMQNSTQMMQMMQNSMMQNNKINPVNTNTNTNTNINTNTNNDIPNYGQNPTKQQLGKMLDAAARKYNIPSDLLKAVAWQESKWNPKASSFDEGHGKGLMQIDDRYHNFANMKDVWDPAKNLDYGANYLSSLYNQTGNWDRALKRYNGGSAYPPLIRKHISDRPWSKYG